MPCPTLILWEWQIFWVEPSDSGKFIEIYPKVDFKDGAWSSLVEGGEGLYLPNCQTTLVIALDALFLLFCIFINTTAYHMGRYEPSPSSTKELHASFHSTA